MRKSTTAILLLTVCAAACFIYAGSLRNPFTYDDLVILSGNANLDDTSNLKHLFTEKYFRISGERSYRPVSTALAFGCVAAGGRNPLPFRITSIAVHALCGALLFLCALALSKRNDIAFFASIIFVAHPLLSEAVNGSSFIEDPLSAMFFLAAFAAYLAGRTGKRPWFLFASLPLSFLAMLAKESAATLPFCLLLYEMTMGRAGINPAPTNQHLANNTVPRAEQLQKFGKPVAAHFALLLLFVIIRFGVFGHSGGAAAGMPGDSIGKSIIIMLAALLKYIQLFLFPFKLSIEQCFSGGGAPAPELAAFSAVLHIAMIAFAIAALRFSRLMSFATFFYLLNLLPVSNIIPFGAVFAERYAYLPAAGLCLLFTCLFIELKDSKNRILNLDTAKINAVFLACATLFFARQTVKRSEDWSSGLALWRKAAAVCPESSRARTNYGRELIAEGQYGDAISQLQEAARLDPMHYEAWNALGSACLMSGDIACANRSYSTALRMHPSNDVRYNLAITHLRSGNPRAAVPLLIEAIKKEPRWHSAHYLLGNAFLKSGNYPAAEAAYLKTLELRPGDINTMGNLGVLYRETNRPEEAKILFMKILEKDPANKFAIKNLEILKSR